jgi:hypothetical protein
MLYGKHFINKPVLGCGVIIDGIQPIFIPIDLGSKIEYTDTKPNQPTVEGVPFISIDRPSKPNVPLYSIDSKLTNPIRTDLGGLLQRSKMTPTPEGVLPKPNMPLYDLLQEYYPQLVETMPANYVRWTKAAYSVEELPLNYSRNVRNAIKLGTW